MRLLGELKEMQVIENENELQKVTEQYIQSMKRENNISAKYERLNRFVLSKINVMTATQEDISNFLGSLRKPDNIDPLHKWIGTYNLYITVLKRFSSGLTIRTVWKA